MDCHDPLEYDPFRKTVALVKEHSSHQRFQSIPVYRLETSSLGIDIQQLMQPHFQCHLVQSGPAYHLGTHFRQKAFILVRVTHKQIMGHCRTYD